MVSTVSKPCGCSIFSVSKSIGFVLLVLSKLNLHWMLISLPAETTVVMGILCTKNSPWSVDWLVL